MPSRALIKEIEAVLRKHGESEYNTRLVIRLISRSQQAKKGVKLAKPAESALDIVVRPGEVVREQRTRLGMSLNELSAKSAIPKSNLSAIENGKRPIGPVTAKKLAKPLQINYRALL